MIFIAKNAETKYESAAAGASDGDLIKSGQNIIFLNTHTYTYTTQNANVF